MSCTSSESCWADMAKRSSGFSAPSRDEQIWGWGYLVVQLLLLPELLKYLNQYMSLSKAELNFTFYLINFLAIMVIFHRFLADNGVQVLRHPVNWVQAVILGGAAYYICNFAINWCVHQLDPTFQNANNENIFSMISGSRYLMFIGTVVLVPPVEECLFRGLVFRSLYGKNHAAAYLVSICVFAFIHMSGYLGSYTPLQLLLCFCQYIPAGLCLAWAYVKGGSIFAPIVIHTLINFLTLQSRT